MLKINVYSTVDSKVFGVKISVNFLLAIVEYKFNDYKHVIKVKNMQLGNMGGKNANYCIDQTN
jgi:hypothetical protein